MGAFDFPRADRQTALYRPWVVQLGQAVTDIAVACRDGVVVVVCFDPWRECFQDGIDLICLQAALLLLHPRLGIGGGTHFGRLTEIFTKMKKVHEKRPLRAKAKV